MSATYYVQLNLLCIMFLCAVFYRLRNKRETISSRRRTFLRLVWCAVILCLSDIAAGLSNKAQFSGATSFIETSNIIYFLAISWCCFIWMIFVKQRLNGLEYNYKRFMTYAAIPLLVITLVILLNPLLHFMFTVTENNEYVRGQGIYLHWLVSWGYLFWSEIIVLQKMKNEPSKINRRKMVPLLWFIVAPAIAAIMQMLFYGVSAMQCGVTFSVVLMTFGVLQEKISMDSLTGLNNRSALENYLSDQLLRLRPRLTMFMCDVDHFKQINDTLGHLMGDLALKNVALILKDACGKCSERLFLCRYGGDEFVICGANLSEESAQKLQRDITEGLETFNKGSHNVFTLEISIGRTEGLCHGFEDAEKLVREADDNMYKNKRSKK